MAHKKKGPKTATKMTELVISTLEDAFRNDYTLQEALTAADISEPTYRTWLKRYPEFRVRIAKAKQELITKAKRNIAKYVIDGGDKEDSKWVLERRQKERYSTKTEVKNENPDVQQLHGFLSKIIK